MTRIPPFFAGYQARVESELRRLSSDTGDRVERAIAYTLHAPSKRVRAVLTMLAAELCGERQRARPSPRPRSKWSTLHP
jgi:geranylgeranyl pyrophosphate synthase